MNRPTFLRYWVCVCWLAELALASGPVEVPAGTLLEMRLQQEINSYSSRVGDPVQGVLIAPVVIDGGVVIPAGTTVLGSVEGVRRVGIGLLWETATLELRFTRLVLTGGQAFPLDAKLLEVENAREGVDARGRIQGIRSTATPGYRASALLTTLAAVDPIALAFSTAGFASILRFSEPEVRFEPGTEMLLRTTAPFLAEPSEGFVVPAIATSGQRQSDLQTLVETMPYRTHTALSGEPSDFTNLILIGDRWAIERAFEAAGWHHADRSTAAARYRALRSLAEYQEYQEAPMSTLLLDGEEAMLSLSKAQNTFSKRHHLRIFARPDIWNGRSVYTAAATHDVGLGFAARRNVFIHVIDERIDNERAKVVHDLLFTGCVDGAETVERPWLPEVARNATGQSLFTDRAVAVLRFNDCRAPRRFDESVEEAPGPYRGNRAQRITRQTLLVIRNDLYRGNLIYQGVSTAMLFQQYLRNRSRNRTERPERELGVSGPAAVGESGEFVASALLPGQSAMGPTLSNRPFGQATLSGGDPWVPPLVELGFHTGGLVFSRSTVGAEGLLLTKTRAGHTPLRFMLTAGNRINPGFAIGGTVTLNSRRRISNEFGFDLQRSEFLMDLQGVGPSGGPVSGRVEEQKSVLITRQFTYSTLLHLTPRESRIRPYVAAGPALQLLHLSNSPFRKAEGMFRFAMKDVGMLRAAYSFGRDAPLEGGGVFQPGLQLGGGVKIRVSPHWTLRFDCRNMLSPRPDLLRKSLLNVYEDLQTGNENNRIENLPSFGRGRLLQHRLTTGLAFTF